MCGVGRGGGRTETQEAIQRREEQFTFTGLFGLLLLRRLARDNRHLLLRALISSLSHYSGHSDLTKSTKKSTESLQKKYKKIEIPRVSQSLEVRKSDIIQCYCIIIYEYARPSESERPRVLNLLVALLYGTSATMNELE